MNNKNHSGLRLYIGHQEFGKQYYINTKGEHYITKHTPIFGNMDDLLGYLKERYKKRKAKLVAINDGVPGFERKEILNFILKNKLRIHVSKRLEDRFK